MESKATSTSSGQAKDVFLHLGSMVGLYATAIAFLNLIFRTIDKLHPEISSYYYYSSSSQISFPVATLIIIFPLFLWLTKLINQSYNTDPSKKNLGIRRWLTYITLFVAGVILAGDLVFVLYKFLDGQNITTSFTLKALAVLLVAGAVFKYYLLDIKDQPLNRRRMAYAASVIIVAAIVLGFSVIGSPASQRQMREDEQTVSMLQSRQWDVENYWQIQDKLPESYTSEDLEYKKTGEETYELCATFNLASEPLPKSVPINDSWEHPAGEYCFKRAVNPALYPIKPVR